MGGKPHAGAGTGSGTAAAGLAAVHLRGAVERPRSRAPSPWSPPGGRPPGRCPSCGPAPRASWPSGPRCRRSGPWVTCGFLQGSAKGSGTRGPPCHGRSRGSTPLRPDRRGRLDRGFCTGGRVARGIEVDTRGLVVPSSLDRRRRRAPRRSAGLVLQPRPRRRGGRRTAARWPGPGRWSGTSTVWRTSPSSTTSAATVLHDPARAVRRRHRPGPRWSTPRATRSPSTRAAGCSATSATPRTPPATRSWTPSSGCMHDLTEECGLDTYLMYGCLLGAIRDGHMIGHDSDADVAYLSASTTTPSTSSASAPPRSAG